jgi:transcriptional regulator with XRE-family HTH domain
MIDSSNVSLDSTEKSKVKLKQHLREHLDKYGITATQLARKSGVSKQVISTWLNGASPRRLEQVKKVADAMGVSIDELCFGIPKQESSQPPQFKINDEWLSGIFEIKMRKLK